MGNVALCWENDLGEVETTELSEALGSIFGSADPAAKPLFADRRSWAGARPELRLIVRDEAGIAGHVGFLRRFIRVDGTDQLVGELGLVAVRADRQSSGLGRRLLEESDAALRGLGVPFGFLGCKPDAEGFYLRNGWTRLDARARHPENRTTWRVSMPDEVLFIRPVTAAVADWPAGAVVDWNGLKL
ncbi:GNAT family N-acetyltransferase [Actinomycetes bacterium KLBMP 9759]